MKELDKLCDYQESSVGVVRGTVGRLLSPTVQDHGCEGKQVAGRHFRCGGYHSPSLHRIDIVGEVWGRIGYVLEWIGRMT